VGADYDCKDGQPGLQTLAQHKLLGLLDTFRVRSPSGGEHGYFLRRGGQGVIHNSVKKATTAPGVDFRGWHGYLVGPGSIIDGRKYEIIEDVPIAELPVELEQIAVSAGGSVGRRNGQDAAPVGELDTEAALTLAQGYLMKDAPLAVEGAGGDNTTFRVACRVKDLGVSEGECLELMLAHWNERCSPPWDAGDLERKVRNAFAYGQEPPGSANVFEEFAGAADPQWKPETRAEWEARQPKKPAKQRSDWPVAYYLEELQRFAIEPLRWVVPDFILAGVVNGLFGDGGVGKDLLMLQLGIAKACGARWLGRSVDPGRVMYFPVEDTVAELRRREARITAHYQSLEQYNPVPEQFKIVPLFGQSATLAAFSHSNGRVVPTDAFEVLCAMIADFRPDLVMVGNRVNIFSVNQNDDAQAVQCLQLLTQICDRYKTTVIMPGHVSVASLRSGTGTSGSVQWSNGVRMRNFLHRIINDDGTEDDSNARVLETMKSNWSMTGQTIPMRWTEGLFVADTDEVDDVEVEQSPEQREAEDDAEVLRLFDELALVGDHVSPKDQAPNNISSRLSKRGKFKRLGKAGRRRVEASWMRLAAQGVLESVPIGPPSRRTYQIVRKMQSEPSLKEE
jgi:AAA domain/Bifunctional DNA primase/polymerase, N-terminal